MRGVLFDAEEGGPFQCRPGVPLNADPGVPKNAEGGSLSLPVSTLGVLPFYSKTPRSFFRNPMRSIIVTTTVFFACTNLHSYASPTAVGLHANNSADTASIYTDTTNRKLFWVTPPTLGRLEIAQETLAIDKPTCQSVASLYRTRRSMFVQLENYNARIESIQVAISALF